MSDAGPSPVRASASSPARPARTGGPIWRLLVLVLAFGVIGASLLSMRQRRLQAISDMTEAQRRILAHDRTLWQLRAEIGRRVTPPSVREMIARSDRDWLPGAGEVDATLGEPALARADDPADPEREP